jgi:hypothetical protein
MGALGGPAIAKEIGYQPSDFGLLALRGSQNVVSRSASVACNRLSDAFATDQAVFQGGRERMFCRVANSACVLKIAGLPPGRPHLPMSVRSDNTRTGGQHARRMRSRTKEARLMIL